MTAIELAAEILRRDADDVRTRIKVSPQYTNRASSLGHPCEMHGYLNRTAWDKAAPPTESLQRIFDRGNALEPIIRRELEDLGIRLTGEQSPLAWKELEISGHNDFAIADTEQWGRCVAEIKTTGNPMFARAHSHEDLLRSELGQRWYGQIQLYMLLGNYEQGLLIIKDVLTWQLVVIPVALDYSYAETLLQRAEKINAAVKAKTSDGLAMVTDPRICRRCPHYGVSCTPSVNFGEGVQVVADEHLEELLDRRAELEDASREYKEVDEEVKAQAKHLGGTIIAGNWLLENTVRTRTQVDVPTELRNQYSKTIEYVQTKITRL